MTYDQEYRLSPRKILRNGDPVKIDGVRGKLYRFQGVDAEATTALLSDDVGRARFVQPTSLRSAGRTPPEKVALDDRLAIISKAAKTGARRRRRA
jgi:hypothetical protein